MLNKKNRKRIGQKGITLLEILAAMMIFGFIIGGIVLFGVRALEAHTKSQAMQNALENARFAIESLNKRARTSNGILPAGNSQQVFFIDNASGNSYCYEFDGSHNGSLVAWIGDGETTASCAEVQAAPIQTADVVGSSSADVDISIFGSFEIKESSSTERGFLRTNMTVAYEGNLGVQSESSQTIQSTVSLRDY